MGQVFDPKKLFAGYQKPEDMEVVKGKWVHPRFSYGLYPDRGGGRILGATQNETSESTPEGTNQDHGEEHMDEGPGEPMQGVQAEGPGEAFEDELIVAVAGKLIEPFAASSSAQGARPQLGGAGAVFFGPGNIFNQPLRLRHPSTTEQDMLFLAAQAALRSVIALVRHDGAILAQHRARQDRANTNTNTVNNDDDEDKENQAPLSSLHLPLYPLRRLILKTDARILAEAATAEGLAWIQGRGGLNSDLEYLRDPADARAVAQRVEDLRALGVDVRIWHVPAAMGENRQARRLADKAATELPASDT